VSNELEVSSNVYDAIDEAKRKYYTDFQQTEDSNTKHVKTIKDLVGPIKYYGGSMCNDAGLIEHKKKSCRHMKDEEVYLNIVRAKILGCAIIKCANGERYKSLIKDVRSQYSYRQDTYPKSIDKAYDMLKNVNY